MKAAIALSLLGCVLGFSGKAFADWGPCTVDGTTYHYNVDVDVGVSEARKNIPAGTVLQDVVNWSNRQYLIFKY